ncbi:hypothetical protein SAMN05446927_5276 [Caballeronia arationis]|uniref:Uncharacterized protein n=1 Tax=Caballeronia arationis TaxID=1777142 RepID=A0A7Z7N588_9BURK|nr:hypothetical protein [Caballeronia arationis]SOE81973.1 hypothetical protein SAMN05446927_5276 [Caballeronia arationis]
MKIKTVAAFLVFFSTNVFAEYDIKPLREQIANMDSAITSRNALIDGLSGTLSAHDSNLLSTFNSYELSIEFTMGALESFLLILNNAEQEKNKDLIKAEVEQMRSSLADICGTQILEMHVTRGAIENAVIRKDIEKQIANAGASCDLIRGTFKKDGHVRRLY